MNGNNDVLKKYIVRIEYSADGFTSEGSGVIVPLEKKENRFYIFTAKHTFFKDNTNNVDMDETKIDENKIKIKIFDFNNKETNSQVLSVIGIGREYDFVILVVEKSISLSPDTPLPIDTGDFKDCKICGFPTSKKLDTDKSILFDCTYSTRDDNSDTYEVKSNTLLTTKGINLNANVAISGLSGAGVFVESATGKLYLAGIQIKTASHNSLVCLDIRILAREINEALKDNNCPSVEIDSYVLKEEWGIDISKLDFNKMLNKLKLDKLKDEELNKLKEKPYKELIKDFNRGIKQNLDKESKELAKKYLYLSLLFHKNEDNRRSTIYFKKAVKNNPSYYALFLKAKDERGLNDKQKEKYSEINSEVSNSDIFADDLFFEMLEDKLEKIEDFDEKEGVYIQMIKLLETKLRELENGSDFEEKKKELIFEKSIELFEWYLSEKKLDDADNLLFDLKEKKYSVDEYIYQLYTNQNFWKNSSSSKQELSKRYLDLLDRFKDDEERFKKLKEQLDLLYDETDGARRELNGVKEQIKKYEEQINSLEDMFTKYIKDEKVLNKVNFVSEKIDKSTNEITKKIDEVKVTIIKTNNQKLNNFLENVYRSNQALVSKIQTMYHQNDRVSKQAFIILNNSIKSMNEKIEECLNRPVPDAKPTNEDSNNNQVDIEKIIKESNLNFYKAIQCLYEKDSDSYNRKLLEMSIAFTKKEHELHIENLKGSHQNELLKVKEEANAINSKKLIHISEQVGKSHQKLDNIWKQLNKLQSGFVQTIQENNQKLIDEIGKIFPEIKGELESILNKNKEEIKIVINRPMKHVKRVVEICNSSLYGKIEELFNEHKELSKEKILLELAMESTKKENKEAFFELERQHQDEIKKIKKEQIEWERGLDTKYKEKTHEACKKLISLTGTKQIKKLEKESQTLEHKIEQKNQELIPYKKKHEEEEKLKSEKKKYNEEFMKRIKLRASLKNKLSYTFNYFHRVEEKIQTLTSEFDNDLKKLYDEIKNIEKAIEKFSKEKYFDMIQEMEVKIEGKKTIFLKKIEDDNRTKKEKDKYIKIVVFLVFITILIGVSIEVF